MLNAVWRINFFFQCERQRERSIWSGVFRKASQTVALTWILNKERSSPAVSLNRNYDPSGSSGSRWFQVSVLFSHWFSVLQQWEHHWNSEPIPPRLLSKNSEPGLPERYWFLKSCDVIMFWLDNVLVRSLVRSRASHLGQLFSNPIFQSGKIFKALILDPGMKRKFIGQVRTHNILPFNKGARQRLENFLQTSV